MRNEEGITTVGVAIVVLAIISAAAVLSYFVYTPVTYSKATANTTVKVVEAKYVPGEDFLNTYDKYQVIFDSGTPVVFSYGGTCDYLISPEVKEKPLFESGGTYVITWQSSAYKWIVVGVHKTNG